MLVILINRYRIKTRNAMRDFMASVLLLYSACSLKVQIFVNYLTINIFR
jgi:hypothetical protein